MNSNMLREGGNQFRDENKVEDFSSEEKELISLGKDQDNEFKIVRRKQESKGGLKLKPEILTKAGLSPEDKELIDLILEKIEGFINGPIIVDTFNKDNNKRRAWESECLPTDNLKAAVNYYSSNKLARTNFAAMSYLIYHLLHNDLVNSEMKAELTTIEEKISLIDEKYNNMEIEQKLKAIEDLSILAAELLEKVAVTNQN